MAQHSKFFPIDSLVALKVFLTLATGVLRIPFVQQKNSRTEDSSWKYKHPAWFQVMTPNPGMYCVENSAH